MTRNDLRDPTVLKKIAELKSAECSWQHIIDTLEADMGIKTSIPAAQNAYNVFVSRSSEIMAGDEALKGVLKSVVYNVSDKLKKIGDKMDQILDMNRATPDQWIAASREILNQLCFQQKMLNTMQQSFDWGKISKIEYTKVSTVNLEELDKADHIIIIRKPGLPPLAPAFIAKLRKMIEDEYAKYGITIEVEEKKEEEENGETDTIEEKTDEE